MAPGVHASASTDYSKVLALPETAEFAAGQWCKVTLATPAAVQTLVGQVVGRPITSGRHAGSFKVRPVALRRVYSTALALMMLEAEPALHHDQELIRRRLEVGVGWHGVEGCACKGLAGRDEACELTTTAVGAKVAAEGTPTVMVADGGERALGVFA